MIKPQYTGRHIAPHAEQSRREGPSHRSLVLQEGARLLEPPPKEDEKLAEEDQAWQAGCLGRRSVRAICGFDNNQVKKRENCEASVFQKLNTCAADS